MKCSKCNAIIPDDSKFCDTCGAKVEIIQFDTQDSQPVVDKVEDNQVKPPKKPLNKKFIAIGAAVVCVVVIGLIFLLTQKKTINLNDYVSVSFNGYEGYGVAEISFDSQKFDEEMQKIVNDKTNFNDYYTMYSSLNWQVDKSDHLKNDDKVKLTFKFDNEAANKLGIQLKGDDTEYTVSGLEKVREVDPFKDIKVTFSGISPNVSVSVENNSSDEAISQIYFHCEPYYGVAKGDKIIVSANIDEEEFIKQYGIKLTALSKEYTCDKVDTYIMDGKEIGEKALNEVKKESENTISEYFADNVDDISISELKYAGYYFLSTKKTSIWGYKNVMYVVYSGKVKSTGENGFKPTTVYFPVRFTDIIKLADGNDSIDLDQAYIVGSTDLDFGLFNSVPGYEKKSDMKEDLITDAQDNYNTQKFGDLD